VKRFLVTQLARLGDIVQAIPLLQGLKKVYPDCWVEVLVNKKFSEICTLMPWIDEVVTIDFPRVGQLLVGDTASLEKAYGYLKTFYSQLKARAFTRVFNITPHYLGVFSAMLSRNNQLDDQESSEWQVYFKSVTMQWNTLSFHMSDLYICIAGLEPSNEQVRLVIDKKSKQWADEFLRAYGLQGDEIIIAFHPGASTPHKQWPRDYFIRLGKKLLETQRIMIMLLGTEDASDLCHHFGNRCINATGKTTVAQLAALLQRTHVFVTNDTGPMHIAAACGTFVISIHMGKENCFTTGPRTLRGFTVQPALPCHPCQYPEHCTAQTCKKNIEPDLIYELILRSLNPYQYSNSTMLSMDKAVVYHAGHDPMGFWDFYPLTHKKLTIDDLMHRLLRYVWKHTLDYSCTTQNSTNIQAYVQKLGITLEHFYKKNDSLKIHCCELDRALQELSALCGQGMNVCKDIIRYAPSALRFHKCLQRLAEECEKIDNALATWKERMPILRPLINTFFTHKEESTGDDIEQLAQEAYRCYEQLHTRCGMLRALAKEYQRQSMQEVTKAALQTAFA